MRPQKNKGLYLHPSKPIKYKNDLDPSFIPFYSHDHPNIGKNIGNSKSPSKSFNLKIDLDQFENHRLKSQINNDLKTENSQPLQNPRIFPQIKTTTVHKPPQTTKEEFNVLFQKPKKFMNKSQKIPKRSKTQMNTYQLPRPSNYNELPIKSQNYIQKQPSVDHSKPRTQKNLNNSSNIFQHFQEYESSHTSQPQDLFSPIIIQPSNSIKKRAKTPNQYDNKSSSSPKKRTHSNFSNKNSSQYGNEGEQQSKQKKPEQKQKYKHHKPKKIDLLKNQNLQFLADERKQQQIQNVFYQLNLSPQLVPESPPEISFPQIPPLKLFESPNLPPSPGLNQPHQSYIQSVIGLCSILQININYFDVKIKKFHNCILFYEDNQQKCIIWYYDGRFYFGGWLKEDEQISQEANKNSKDIKFGKKEGMAIQYSGSYWYKGMFKRNKKHGKGVLISNQGDVYDGDWENGKKHGVGTFYNKAKETYYHGFWKNDKEQGEGSILYSKKHYYKGSFKASKKNGKGIEHYENGDIYAGNFMNNLFEGSGKYYWVSGSTYNGQFRRGTRNGIGLWKAAPQGQNKQGLKIANKKIYYYGQFVTNERCGYGIEYEKSGCLYKGYFLKNQRNGVGVLKQGNGKLTKGQWKAGKIFTFSYEIKEK